MAAEDSQPNEALKRSKFNRDVPVIRTSLPPKWHTGRKHMRMGGISHRARWNRQTPTQIRHSGTQDVGPSRYNSSINTTGQPSHHTNTDDAPLASLAPRNISWNKPKPSGPLFPAYSQRSQACRRYEDTRTVSYRPNGGPTRMGGGMHLTKRRSHEREPGGGEPPQKRTKRVMRKPNETKVELPPQCRRNAFRRSHFKTIFLTDLCARLKQSMDVEIIRHCFTDTHLIITYAIPDVFPESDVAPVTGLSSHLNSRNVILSDSSTDLTGSFDYVAGDSNSSSARTLEQPFTPMTLNAPSGSNVKLEDSYRRASSLNEALNNGSSLPESMKKSPPTGYEHHSSTIQDIEATLATPRQISYLPRRFRSGVISMLNGPRSLESGIVFPTKERTLLDSEAIEFDETPPPFPGQKRESVRIDDVGQYDGVARSPPIDVEEEVGIIKSRSTELSVREDTPTTVQLPRTSGDKARRLLVSTSEDMVYSVTMHGFVHEASMKRTGHFRKLYSSPDVDKEFVEDVSLFLPPFDNIAVVAQIHEETALSLLRLDYGNEEHRVTPVARTSADRERHRRGVSAITALPTSGSSLSFVSAGYDHVVHLWSFDPSSAFEQPPVAGIIDIHHSSLVQSLLSVEDRLLSGGADNSVRTWDLRAAQMISTMRTSNSVYQLHRTESPDTVLIEIGHRNLQFELHDCRLPASDQPPIRFGYPATQGLHGRYIRGAIDPHAWTTFSSGGRDGMVRLWDLRNVTQCKKEIMCFPGQKIVHAAFTQDKLVVASGDNRLLLFDIARI